MGSNVDAPALEDKEEFSHLIYRINQNQIGVVVEKLDARCPDAIETGDADDEIELNIDAIDPATFRTLFAFMKACLRANETTDGALPKIEALDIEP